MRKYFLKINTNNKKEKFIISFFIILGLFFSITFSFFQNAEAAINKQINYQGKLTLASGVAVPNSSISIVFSLYTAATGGTAIWTETQSVTPNNGLFSVMLGEVTALTSVDFNQTLYLGVKVGADSEMTPRKKLGTVPSAIISESSINSINTTNTAITEDITTATSVYPTWVTSNSGMLGQKTSSTKLSLTF